MYSLPVVKNEICGSLEREVCNIDEDEYIDEKLAKLEIDNPTIAAWIRRYTEATDDPTSVAMCAIITYRLLESQAESNKMNLELVLG